MKPFTTLALVFILFVQDAQLNKITRNLSDANPESLGIGPQYR